MEVPRDRRMDGLAIVVETYPTRKMTFIRKGTISRMESFELTVDVLFCSPYFVYVWFRKMEIWSRYKQNCIGSHSNTLLLPRLRFPVDHVTYDSFLP